MGPTLAMMLKLAAAMDEGKEQDTTAESRGMSLKSIR